MRQILTLAFLLAVAPMGYAEDSALERAARKTGEILQRGADKVSPSLDRAGKAIERGVKAAGRGVERAGAAAQKGAEKVHRKVDEKVRPNR